MRVVAQDLLLSCTLLMMGADTVPTGGEVKGSERQVPGRSSTLLLAFSGGGSASRLLLAVSNRNRRMRNVGKGRPLCLHSDCPWVVKKGPRGAQKCLQLVIQSMLLCGSKSTSSLRRTAPLCGLRRLPESSVAISFDDMLPELHKTFKGADRRAILNPAR